MNIIISNLLADMNKFINFPLYSAKDVNIDTFLNSYNMFP